LGSGALISSDGTVITNYHVVAGSSVVGVVFKPAQEGAQITRRDLVRGEVVKIDQVADLALIKVAIVPAGVRPLSLGSTQDVVVGADVHAIGHPTGEAWTYTRGIVSQIRRGYQWTTESNLSHTATVIQTQTPINPGNSGGPLLDNQGRLIGINSFKSEGEALNFAVSVDEVRQIIKQPSDRYTKSTNASQRSSASGQCEPREGASRRINDPKGSSVPMDVDCNGTYESLLVVPDAQDAATQLIVDTDADGRFDYAAFDTDRDGNIDESYYDTDGNGKPDVVGYHRAGSAEPYKYEKLE